MEMTAASSGRPALSNPSITLLLLVLLAGILLAGKILTIHLYGNPTPYWDQWDAEAARLYKPWVEGDLEVADLVEPHNEHRIFTTRLVHLALFELMGRRWDPLAQMYGNAFLHAAAVLFLVVFACSAVPPHLRPFLCMFASVLFFVPFGWENTLSAFQAQFYLLLIQSVALLWICSTRAINTSDGIWCLLLAAGLVLTMASGALGVLAAAGVLAFRRLALADCTVPVPLVALLGAIAFFGIIITPQIPGHAHLKAQSFEQFAAALGRTLAWPLAGDRSTLTIALGASFLQLPLLLGILVTFRNPEARRSLLFLLAIGGWFLLQAMALAYGRAGDVLTSRYLDSLSLGVLANFAGLLILWGQSKQTWRWAVAFLMAGWLAVLTLSMWAALPGLRQEIVQKAISSRTQEQNVRGYLQSGRAQWLYDAEFHAIPYPSPERLQQLLDDPTIRGFLPASLFGSSAQCLLPPGGELVPAQ